ncbi:site-specific integrase [Kiloniella laminariae]|uniref:Site-specific integrase n=1 Tax=Kiloniella laminariae TaxID=454162 RepID=A0ABT4LKR2_9PROT|nr:site-specific integrase [Kiloniella laminariae]MCZ4281669.1 site-specific integrase [Kiloniella laminariae]
MATFKKREKKWVAEVRIKGRYASKTFLTKLEAQAWAVEKEQDFGRQTGLVQGKTASDAFDRYAKEISPTKKGARWEDIRLQKLKRSGLADISLLQLSTEDINDWIKESAKTLSAGSIHREFHLIGSVMEAARKRWKWIEKNPCRDAELPKEPPPRDRRLSDQEIAIILRALDYKEGEKPKTSRQRLAIAFLLAIETAMRQGEIWGLTWDNVFLEGRYVHLPDTKNGTKRDVPLSTAAVELLTLFLPTEDNKVFKGSQVAAATMFRRIINEKCKIFDLKFHDTRHEALTRLARKIDVLDLARMVGHKDPRSLMIYYNPTASEIAQRLG